MNKKIKILFSSILALVLVTSIWSNCLASILTADMHYPGLDQQQHACPVSIDEAWFGEDNTKYNHDLATATLCLAMSGFRASKHDYSVTDKNAHQLFRDLGFTNYRALQYHNKPEPDTIATAMAMRQMEDKDGPFTLLAVSVCGQGYGNEWVGNFTVGEYQQHLGFAYAASLVYDRILKYREDFIPEGRVKLWMGGFSRSAAVSNLAADMILSDGALPEDCVYVYTFATPNCTTVPTPWPQIYNICNTMDVVPKVPLSSWGYDKHGMTLYLPCRQSTMNYQQMADDAKAVYAALGMDPEKFGSADDRDWLLGWVLKVLGGYLPKASDSDGMQQAAAVAFLTEGSITDKLNAVADVLSSQMTRREKLTFDAMISTILPDLLSRSVNDTLNELASNGSATKWLNLFSSGVDLVYEHKPEIYLAWMNSTNDVNALFGHPSGCMQVSWTGDLDSHIYLVNEDGSKTLWFDSVTFEGPCSHLQLGNQFYVNLPLGHQWSIKLTAPVGTSSQISWELQDPAMVKDNCMRTNIIQVEQGETITLNIPADLNDVSTLTADLNDGTKIGVDPAAQLVTAGRNRRAAAEQYITGMIVMVPYLLLGLVTLLYALTVGVLRLMHGGALKDNVSINKAGRIVLYVTAVLCLLGVITHTIGIFNAWGFGSSRLTNRTMLRISQFIGWGMRGYEITCVILYSVFGAMCLVSIHHGLERIRLMRFAILLGLVNLIEVAVSIFISTFTIPQLLVLLVPRLAMAGVWLGRDRNDQARARNKLLRPIRIGLTFTLLLFFARQAVIFWFEDVTIGSAVFLKLATGIPAVLLALQVYRHCKTREHKLILYALCVSLAADMSINLNTYVGMAFFAASHLMMIFTFHGWKKPTLKGILSLLVIWAVLVAMILRIGIWLPRSMAISCIVFSLLTAALPVSAVHQSGRIRFGVLMLVFVDVMVAVKITFPGNMLLDFVELLEYYLSIFVIASDGKALIPPELMPEYHEKHHHRGKTAEA